MRIASCSASALLDPYDFSGHFSYTFDNVQFEYGDFPVDIQAIYPVSHESATETLTATVSGMATDGLVNIPNPNPRGWQQYTDVEFDSDPGLQDPDYTAPEFHGYLLELVGSPAVLAGVSNITTAGGTFPVQQFSDGNYYAYSINSSGGATVPMVMHFQPVSTDWNPTVPQPADDDNSTASFVEGLAVGFGSGFPSLVSGTWTLIQSIPGAIADYNPWTLAYNYADRYCNGDTFDAEKSFISATGSALTKVGNIVTQLETDPTLIQALLTGDTNTVGELSPDLQATLTTVAELLVKLQDQFTGLSKYEQGRIVGRTIFEVGNLVAGGELLKLGKAGLLKSLSNIKFFQECGPAANALAAVQPFVAKLTAILKLTGLRAGSAEGLRAEELLSLWQHFRDVNPSLSAWDAWQDVATFAQTADLKGQIGFTMAQAIIAQAYQEGVVNGVVDLSKLPTWTDIDSVLKPGDLENHHVVPIQIQKLLNMNPGNFDDCPGFLLPKEVHVGPGSFHDLLKDNLKNLGQNPKPADILNALQKTYSDVTRPDLWAAAKAWLATQGIQ